MIPTVIKNKLLNKNPEYTRVELDNCSLDDKDIHELIKLLQDNPFVKHLSLRRNNLRNESIPTFKNIPSTIEYIDLSLNNFDNAATDAILEVFKDIKKLDLSDNGFTDEFALKLSQHAAQEYLRIVGNEISIELQEMVALRVANNKATQPQSKVASSLSAVEPLTEKLTLCGQKNIEELCKLIDDPAQKHLFLEALGSKINDLAKIYDIKDKPTYKPHKFFNS